MNAANNPFATQFVSPGRIPYFFKSPSDRQIILDKADAADWSVQIVGPHGSGKTTLVHHLLPDLKGRFESIEYIIVRSPLDIQRCRPVPHLSLRHEPALRNCVIRKRKTLLVVDGVERLSWLQRWLLRSDCRRRSMGLIVTTHRKLYGLSVVCETSVDEIRFEMILEHLGADGFQGQFRSLAQTHRNNCRDMLFDLYDRHGEK